MNDTNPTRTSTRRLLPDTLASGARFSRCGRYRYTLWRQWNPARGTCLFIMLNPSTADAGGDDPTVAKCGRYARRWGFGRLEVRNIFALRSTDPAGLRRVYDPVGPGNDAAIARAARQADLVICAWGAHGSYLDRGQRVLALIAGLGVDAYCLEKNADGAPRHPLYVTDSRQPMRLG
ncbi:MAG: DUF1643 domain-containing protein [Gammaproteobacteria bacterium]